MSLTSPGLFLSRYLSLRQDHQTRYFAIRTSNYVINIIFTTIRNIVITWLYSLCEYATP
ncbi:Protein of unknown function [Pyronema omphalodes CBS 100304]|uniref:Uncharacterized protein n=1 Tax=Pyronema omphalodes (strain CBS 100304) TaxID=1076935 RepID=U4LCP5_PYROM|nr:Protein of unknown function [Pyronema omphalodes CBS 100304]